MESTFPIFPVVIDEGTGRQQRPSLQDSNTHNKGNDDYPTVNHNTNDNDITVKILLSRPYYRLGGTPVVGTILIAQQESQQLSMESETNAANQQSSCNSSRCIRDGIESIQFSMIGLCRYDPRWFNAAPANTDMFEMERTITGNNASHPSLSSSNIRRCNVGLPTGYVVPPHTVPFWSANHHGEPLELIHAGTATTTAIMERNFGKWENVNPMNSISLPSNIRRDARWNQQQPQLLPVVATREEGSTTTTATATTNGSSSNSHPFKKPNMYNHTLESRNDMNEQWKNSLLESSSIAGTRKNRTGLDEKRQLAYTFRINVPQHHGTATLADTLQNGNDSQDQQQSPQPHTFHGVSCRYYYVLVVRLQLRNAISSTTTAAPAAAVRPTVQWTQYPVSILPAFHPNDDCCRPTSSSSCSVASSNIQIMAHSNGLPTRLTAIELNQWEGRYTVNRCGSTLYRNIGSISGSGGVQQQHCMSIIDPTTQCMVGLLTIFGTPNNLHPGSRLSLKMDFPIHHHHHHEPTSVNNRNSNDAQSETTTTKFIPCYQISACLQGQEIAVTLSSKKQTSSNTKDAGASKRTTARRYIWDTAHEMIDPETTECVTLNLLVPETIPCSIRTDNVEMNIQCIIDIAIGTLPNKKGIRRSIDYGNIHLEIPCHVRPTIHDWEKQTNIDDEDEEGVSSQQFQSTVRKLFTSAKQLRQQQQQQQERNDGTIIELPLDTDDRNTYSNNPVDFETADIQTDLKLLSLQMAKICHLKPKPIGWE